MSIKDRGFASASKERRKELASKGGKRAHELNKAHQFTSEEASSARAKGVARAKGQQAQKAALRLLSSGFSVVELAGLKLSFDEYIYYGGAKSTNEKLRELRKRCSD